MNNPFFKLVCSAAAVVAMGSQAFAQNMKPAAKDSCVSPWQQGIDEFPAQPAAAPNPMAAIATKGWDVFFDASFIYWHADQEYMDLGKTDTTTAGTPASNAATSVAFTDYSYNPGFKVGFGFGTGYDGWVGNVEYTWLHQEDNTSIGAPAADLTLTSAWTNNDWFTGVSAANTPARIQASSINAEWKLHLDMLDANLSRPYYQGRDLTILPYAGMRGLWIRQRNDINMVYQATPTAPAASSENKQQSWAVGPDMGVNAHWLLGWGFRFEGFGGGSILYTRYTTVAHDEHNSAPGQAVNAANVISTGKITDYNTLRPTLEAGVGLGWGTYFSNLGYAFDLMARYDFMVLFNQNMMRYNARLVNALSTSTNPIGDLHLHGLTLTARMDF